MAVRAQVIAIPKGREIIIIVQTVERENMRFVPIKTEDQLDVQALHRVRERLVSRRTSVINQLRAFLLERGISLAKGPASLRRQMPEILENADERLTARMRRLLDFLWQEWKHLQLQIESLNEDLEHIASSDAACVRLQQIPGVGPLVATAVVSAIGNGAAFHKGWEFAAWLGLVPGQWSTGVKTNLSPPGTCLSTAIANRCFQIGRKHSRHRAGFSISFCLTGTV